MKNKSPISWNDVFRQFMNRSLNMIKREKIKNGNDELVSLHQEHLQMFPLTSRQLTDLVAPSKTFASLPISAIQERHFISTPPVKR